MKCPQDKHEIILWLDCETFEQLQEAAKMSGCGTDIERYIIRTIMEAI